MFAAKFASFLWTGLSRREMALTLWVMFSKSVLIRVTRAIISEGSFAARSSRSI